jgi:ABC-type multidrug transport system fused ATPase/permease subunit
VGHSLGILAVLTVFSLFVALMSAQGETRFPSNRLSLLPSWVASQATGQDLECRLFDDTGIFPLIAGNLLSTNPTHKAAARLLSGLTTVLPTLRTNLGALTTLLALGLLFVLLLSIFAQWRRSAVARAATDLATLLRSQIHRQMYRLGQSSLPTEGTGPIVNLWTREVNDVRDGLLADLDTVPRVYVLGGGLLLIALLISPALTLFLASLGGLVWLTSRRLDRDARMATDSALRDASVQLCLLHEDLGLLRTVRIFGMESYDKDRFDEHLGRFGAADARRIRLEGWLTPTAGLLYGGALTVAFGVLGYNVVVNHQISFASLLLLIASLAGLAFPIRDWLRMNQAIRRANRSSRAVFEFLERQPELHQTVGAKFLSGLTEQITLENVSLDNRSGKTLLDRASLEIQALSKTSIVGLEEDSKLALACLIPRLIDPKSGRVLIDGQDLRDVTLESIRAQVAIVLQADLVFTDSVLVNIGLGDPNCTLSRIIEAAKVAHAHHFIQDLPHGYDTVVGPLGHYLKPDEQFRIALARAALHDPAILIIEEPAIPLDDDTKHLIDDTIARLSVGRTVIMLPKRLSTIRSSDQVILLRNGRVEEAGTPQQLHAESKLFRHILYVEFNEFATGEIEAGPMYASSSVQKGA